LLAVGSAVAHLAFWGLLVVGIVTGELTKRGAAVFLLLWAAGSLVLPRIVWWGGALVTPWIAVLDIVLVFIVVKGDVSLT
jgi:hypothetical protein